MSEQTNAVALSRASVVTLLERQKPAIKAALPSHITPDYFVRVALTAINKQPNLLKCTQESLLEKLMDCSQLGLEPDSVRGLAYLIPFLDKRRGSYVCQLVIGYQGLVDLAYRHPKVKAIRWGVVREGDVWEYEDGLNPKLKWVPLSEDGALLYAWAACDLDGGGQTFAVLNRRQIMKAKAYSRGSDSEYSAWQTNEEGMWAKTAVRALIKRVPKSTELAQALQKDDDSEYVDIHEMVNEKPVIKSRVKTERVVSELPPPTEAMQEQPEIAQSDVAEPPPKSEDKAPDVKQALTQAVSKSGIEWADLSRWTRAHEPTANHINADGFIASISTARAAYMLGQLGAGKIASWLAEHPAQQQEVKPQVEMELAQKPKPEPKPEPKASRTINAIRKVLIEQKVDEPTFMRKLSDGGIVDANTQSLDQIPEGRAKMILNSMGALLEENQ